MNEIQRLIHEMCPDGVPMVALGEIVTILDSQRKPVSKSDRETGIYPYYGANGIQDYVSNYIFDGTFLLVGEDGSVINKDKSPVLNWATGKIWVNNHAHILEETEKASLRYIGFALAETDISELVHGVPPKLNQANLRSIQIPLPPLPIQQRIVEILDKFTSLVSSLDSEIALRQKQYEYYRNKLYGESIEELLKNEAEGKYTLKSISELGTITRGKRFTREDVVENGVPALHYGDMYTYYGLSSDKANTHLTAEKASKMRFCKKGDVVIVGAGENDWDIGVGVVWLGNEKAAVHDACYILEHNQNPMYISHFLRSNVYHLQLRKYVSDAKICSFSAKDLGRIIIPIPTIDRQLSIVRTLDTFESLLTNLKKERELRQKQYEYYREKLLTFA